MVVDTRTIIVPTLPAGHHVAKILCAGQKNQFHFTLLILMEQSQVFIIYCFKKVSFNLPTWTNLSQLAVYHPCTLLKMSSLHMISFVKLVCCLFIVVFARLAGGWSLHFSITYPDAKVTVGSTPALTFKPFTYPLTPTYPWALTVLLIQRLTQIHPYAWSH